MVTDNVLKQLGMCNYVIKVNVGDMTQEESMIQPKPAGNCANWVVGHILVYRNRLLRGLGAEGTWDVAEDKVYERHEAPLTRAEDAKPVSVLMDGVDETYRRLEQAIKGLTPERLAETAEFIQSEELGGTIETALVVYAFHDAYHAGQTGVLRRIIGRPPAGM